MDAFRRVAKPTRFFLLPRSRLRLLHLLPVVGSDHEGAGWQIASRDAPSR